MYTHIIKKAKIWKYIIKYIIYTHDIYAPVYKNIHILIKIKYDLFFKCSSMDYTLIHWDIATTEFCIRNIITYHIINKFLNNGTVKLIIYMLHMYQKWIPKNKIITIHYVKMHTFIKNTMKKWKEAALAFIGQERDNHKSIIIVLILGLYIDYSALIYLNIQWCHNYYMYNF